MPPFPEARLAPMLLSKAVRILPVAVAAALCAGVARANETAFVNVAGQRPSVLAAVPGTTGDPLIEKLLTRPAD